MHFVTRSELSSTSFGSQFFVTVVNVVVNSIGQIFLRHSTYKIMRELVVQVIQKTQEK